MTDTVRADATALPDSIFFLIKRHKEAAERLHRAHDDTTLELENATDAETIAIDALLMATPTTMAELNAVIGYLEQLNPYSIDVSDVLAMIERVFAGSYDLADRAPSWVAAFVAMWERRGNSLYWSKTSKGEEALAFNLIHGHGVPDPEELWPFEPLMRVDTMWTAKVIAYLKARGQSDGETHRQRRRRVSRRALASDAPSLAAAE